MFTGMKNKFLLLTAALGLVTVASAEEPLNPYQFDTRGGQRAIMSSGGLNPTNTGWTAGAVNRVFGTGNVNFVLKNGVIKSLSIFKVSSVERFHGGECFGLILELLRGPANPVSMDDNGIVGITTHPSPGDPYGYVWHDALTGVDIVSGGNDGFYYIASRNGKVLLTANIVSHGNDTAEFRIETR